MAVQGYCSEEDPSDEKEISFQTLQKNWNRSKTGAQRPSVIYLLVLLIFNASKLFLQRLGVHHLAIKLQKELNFLSFHNAAWRNLNNKQNLNHQQKCTYSWSPFPLPKSSAYYGRCHLFYMATEVEVLPSPCGSYNIKNQRQVRRM